MQICVGQSSTRMASCTTWSSQSSIWSFDWVCECLCNSVKIKWLNVESWSSASRCVKSLHGPTVALLSIVRSTGLACPDFEACHTISSCVRCSWSWIHRWSWSLSGLEKFSGLCTPQREDVFSERLSALARNNTPSFLFSSVSPGKMATFRDSPVRPSVILLANFGFSSSSVAWYGAITRNSHPKNPAIVNWCTLLWLLRFLSHVLVTQRGKRHGFSPCSLKTTSASQHVTLVTAVLS